MTMIASVVVAIPYKLWYVVLLKEVDIMQKEKILSELYRGNLIPVEKSVIPGSELQKYQRQLADLEEEIIAMLDEQSKGKFQSFVEVQNNLIYTSSEERFTDGFRMGVKIILEVFEKDDGQFKPITG